MRKRNLAKEFSKDALLTDAAAVSVAGVAAVSGSLALRILFRQDINLANIAWYVSLGVMSYSVVGLFLIKFWKGRLRRWVPNWLLMSVFGSIVFVAAELTPGIIGGWYDPLRREFSFYEYILNELDAEKSVVLFLCAVTMPMAGLAYYGVSICRVMRRPRLHPEVRTRL